MAIRNATIVGKGALGLLFGQAIARAHGTDAVRFLMDDERYERNASRAITINGETCEFADVRASDAEPADLVIVAVKATGLADAIRSMAGAIGPDTRIISVMNGITSERRIADAYGWDNTVLAIAQGMDVMFIRDELTYVNTGEIRLGPARATADGVVDDIASFLRSSGISTTVESDIEHRLWIKFMLNVGVNQTCMVYRGTYGSISEPDGEQHRCFLAAMREAQAVARAEGIELSEADVDAMVRIIAGLHPDGMPSMAQDRVNEKRSEVDEFAGTVVELADKHGIHVPTNRWLLARVRDIEAGYAR